jgi:hypothetical protein
MDWKHLLAYITGSVDQELLLRNEYLVTEDRMLRNQITGRVRLSDGERKTLAELGQKLGKQALAEVATIVTPDTILGWHRHIPPNLVVRSFRRTLIPSRGQDLQVEHPVGCGYSSALYFHPT